MIKALLMDFNGVIIDDERIQMNAYREVFGGEGVDLSEEDYFSRLGMNDEVFVTDVFADKGRELDPEKVSEMIGAKTDRWRDAVDREIPLFDGVEDFIRRMRNEFTLGLVSMARRSEIDHILGQTGLAECFSSIVSAEDISSVKPDPECYREGFRQVDLVRTSDGRSPLTRRQCVVIEDSPQGIVAGKLNRLKTLGVTNTVRAGKLRKAGADAVTDQLRDWYPDSFRGVFG